MRACVRACVRVFVHLFVRLLVIGFRRSLAFTDHSGLVAGVDGD